MQMTQSIFWLVIILFLFLVLVAAYVRLTRSSKMANQRLEVLLASMGNPVLVTGCDNHPVLANLAARQAFHGKDRPPSE